jgi:hypothetical protein
MPNRTLKVRRLAEIILDGLSEQERQRVLDAATALLPLNPQDWPRERVTRLSDEPVYLLRVPPDLCAFVSPADGVLEIKDVVYEEALKHFSASQRNGAEG